MAMLQIGGTLSNATFRINPKVNWWTSTKQLLAISSAAAVPDSNPNPTVSNAKVNTYNLL